MFLLLISTSDGFGLVYNKKESYIYISLQKQMCYFSTVFCYYNCVTILTTQIL